MSAPGKQPGLEAPLHHDATYLAVVFSTWAVPYPSSGCLLTWGHPRSLRPQTLGSALPAGAFPGLDIQIIMNNKDVFLGDINQDCLQMVVEVYYIIISVVWCWCICLCYCDVERGCPQTDGINQADWKLIDNPWSCSQCPCEQGIIFVFVLFAANASFLGGVSPKFFHRTSQGPRMFQWYLSSHESALLFCLPFRVISRSGCQWWCCFWHRSLGHFPPPPRCAGEGAA